VQVDPIKPKLKPPGTKLLKLKSDILVSTAAFKINLRRYIQELLQRGKKRQDEGEGLSAAEREADGDKIKGLGLHKELQGRGSGRPEVMVGRCRLTLSNPR